MLLTEDGIETESRLLQSLNNKLGKSVMLHGSSKVTEVRPVHQLNTALPSVVTEDGIVIDVSFPQLQKAY